MCALPVDQLPNPGGCVSGTRTDMNRSFQLILAAVVAILAVSIAAAEPQKAFWSADPSQVDFQWGVKIPLRDGVRLNATVYRPKGQKDPQPCIFVLTPYIAQRDHKRGIYFAAYGYPFLAVDSRGRGNSEGEFRPEIQEAKDGYDVVEWLATQPYCNGKVAMQGGSYMGYDQWAVAKEFPPHLATIVPFVSPYFGIDFPMHNNIFSPYDMNWLTSVSGRTGQDTIFEDQSFWTAKYLEWFESGRPFREFDAMVGNPSPVFREWVSHPQLDAYYDSYNPTSEQYARLRIPILTVTGVYDGDQAGALTHYREYMRGASAEGRRRHYLVIGPWDHGGTGVPQTEFGGLKVGPASLVDLPKLRVDWYAWTMKNAPKPDFLRKPVAYYVLGAEKWRYTETLEGITAESRPYHLDSVGNAANDVLMSGTLISGGYGRGKPDQYVYDPRDTSAARQEAGFRHSYVDQSSVFARRGKELVYHTAPFTEDTEVSGFFRLSAWIGIDQPDTDFAVAVYEIALDGSSILLTRDTLRARYRDSLREARLVTTRDAQRYDFNRFTFTSRLIKKGHRLRLVIGPINSIFSEKNYNSGGVVADESIEDARTVVVKLYHDRSHPSLLYVPIAQPE